MFVFQFLQHLLISALVGYLSFTNVLAEKIEVILTPSHNEKNVVTADVKENILEAVSNTTQSLHASLPKILLEHAEYQQAAIQASQKKEANGFNIDDIPLSDAVSDALVNIYCQYKTDTYIRTTTGTGFFINAKGVIITNAHVAQFLLLEDNVDAQDKIECVIRSGNPASPKYIAELLYISPIWIFNNSTVITSESPSGTGERDYALLYISKSVDSTPLPAHFPAIPVDTTLLSRSTEGSTVLTAGYPAEDLMRQGADAKLASVVAQTTVGALYTFGSNYADLFSISESLVGEHGASGGPIVNTDLKSTIGLIVTKGDPATEGEHSLRALTISYIDRTIQEETGFSLAQNMQGDIAYRGAIFKKAMAPFLAQILVDELEH